MENILDETLTDWYYVSVVSKHPVLGLGIFGHRAFLTCFFVQAASAEVLPTECLTLLVDFPIPNYKIYELAYIQVPKYLNDLLPESYRNTPLPRDRVESLATDIFAGCPSRDVDPIIVELDPHAKPTT